MTTIIAVQQKDDVLLGWDSLMTVGNEKATLVQPKVWCSKGLIFGLAGTTRALDIVYCLDFPDYDGSDARSWLVTHVTPLLLDAFKATGQPGVFDVERGSAEIQLIMVVDGTAFLFDSLLSPSSTYEGIYAIGSGADYAKGALYADADVLTALGVAADLDPFSGGILSVRTASSLIIHEDD